MTVSYEARTSRDGLSVVALGTVDQQRTTQVPLHLGSNTADALSTPVRTRQGTAMTKGLHTARELYI